LLGPHNSAFGQSVAIDKNTIIVGAPLEVDKKIGDYPIGAVYIFVRFGDVLQQQARLISPDANDANGEELESFGHSVSIIGELLVVGAPKKGFNPTILDMEVGAVYVFVRDDGFWQKPVRLNAIDSRKGTLFGETVAVSEDAIVIGKPNDSDQSGTIEGIGSIYIVSLFPTPSVLSGSYPSDISIALTCESYCNTIYYTIDGSEPAIDSDGLPLDSTIEYKEPILITDNTTLKYISVGPAGTTTVKTANYVIDRVNPVLEEVTSPINGSTLGELSSIEGIASDDEAGVEQVEIIIQDTTTQQFANMDDEGVFHGWTDTPTWIKANGTTAWQVDTSNIAFVTNNTYTVIARTVDLASNI